MTEKYDFHIEKITYRIDENKESAKYGNILGMDIVFSRNDSPANENRRIKISKILIDNEKNTAENNYSDSTDEFLLKKIISDFYQIDIANINITIREEQNGG